jgi:hypothetical protein
MRTVAWRLVPFLCFIYMVAFIDRINSVGNLGGFLGPYDRLDSQDDRDLHRRPHDFSSHTPRLRDVCHLAASLRETFSAATHNPTLNPTSISQLK